MNEPRLSICIVNWNTRDLLKDCLQSIYADSESEQWEVIVVDNASVDDSVEMVRVSFPLVRLFACEENKGFVGGNNLALQEARGRYWLLLNSDTQVECGSLGILLDFMDATPEAGVIGPKLLNADRSLQLSCGIVPTFYSEMANKLLLHKLFPFFKLGGWDHAQIREVGWVTGACLLVRRTAADQVGLLDPAIFMFYEDLEWCLRIRKGGWKVFYHAFSRVLHLGGQSTRQNFGQMLVISHQSLFYWYRKYFSGLEVVILRLLTPVEMLLRSLVWGLLYCSRPSRRDEARQRLWAYREIVARVLFRSS
ncbi:MAG: glycosyltransferase family 2 protein [Candidatus Latescibacterota bacterium]|jgi:N-acetylglucosaminyl-diphospho-decaprenol L-rhamnosyltransferase